LSGFRIETGGNAAAKILGPILFDANRIPAQIQNRQYPMLAAVAVAEIRIKI
jgi:hypothetical protein